MRRVRFARKRRCQVTFPHSPLSSASHCDDLLVNLSRTSERDTQDPDKVSSLLLKCGHAGFVWPPAQGLQQRERLATDCHSCAVFFITLGDGTGVISLFNQRCQEKD